MFGKEKGDWPTGITTSDYLSQVGVSQTYLKELSSSIFLVIFLFLKDAFTRVNYGQDVQIHALGGLICHLGNTSEFLAPHEGMSSVSKKLLENSKASVRFGNISSSIYSKIKL